MENKSAVIVNTLIEKLKKNKHFFGDIASAETFGKNFAMIDVAMHKDNKLAVYRIIVIKHASK